jgi:hypothetical protein
MTTHSFQNRAFSVALAAVMGLAAFSMPSSAGAQEEWGIGRAEGMEAEARSLADQKDQWEKAAWLYRSAASLRPEGDLEAVEDLQMAGKLAWYTEDADQAMKDLENAAERAMEGGDVFTAANLLVDAAWVATRTGDHTKARDLAGKAEIHAGAPVLSDQVRNRVTDRVIDLGTFTTATAVAVAEDGSGS